MSISYLLPKVMLVISCLFGSEFKFILHFQMFTTLNAYPLGDHQKRLQRALLTPTARFASQQSGIGVIL